MNTIVFIRLTFGNSMCDVEDNTIRTVQFVFSIAQIPIAIAQSIFWPFFTVIFVCFIGIDKYWIDVPITVFLIDIVNR